MVSVAHVQSQQKFIDRDFLAIQLSFGGSTELDRIREIRFIREWEYLALKPTADGRGVWLRIKIGRRPDKTHCCNMWLVDPGGARAPVPPNLIRPIEDRFPGGVPPIYREAGFRVDG